LIVIISDFADDAMQMRVRLSSRRIFAMARNASSAHAKIFFTGCDRKRAQSWISDRKRANQCKVIRLGEGVATPDER
jgi:hypothetical protein